LLHARLLLQSGDTIGAEAQYRLATEAEPGLADPELADRLQISPTTGVGDETESSFGFDLDEPEDRLRASWQPIPETQVDFEVERPDLSFRDVGGMEELKEEIRIKIIHPLAHPELYRAYGKSIGGGILLYGPPGCGKTHLARATAGEIRAKFISVGIHDVLDMWVGSSENRLHALFDQARGNRPCVLFFDEVDALAASRSDLRGAGNRALVNQFLSELDGVEGSNDGVLILAATNAPWHLDPAFRRPGRFDRILFVPPPDGVARAAILRVLCKGKPSQDVDFEQLGKKTTDFSGADLKSAIDLAIEAKLREAMQTGSAKPVTTRDLAAAIARVRPSTREWFGTAKNYALYANQGGLYDDILKHLNLKK
jgi:SpoVK/Ycf46/Vps4 family AAA+-type ATPase